MHFQFFVLFGTLCNAECSHSRNKDDDDGYLDKKRSVIRLKVPLSVAQNATMLKFL